MTLTVGSLFSGIGGFDLGLERAGMQVIWQSEIDEFASRVLKKHWPDVPNLGDITKVDWSEVERPDVICGGYPCQPFSQAGKRGGENDARHLWPAMHNAICVLRPRYALMENVRGHLSLGFGRVLGDLAEIGYDAEWQIIPAAAVGALHKRDRVFIVAYPNDTGNRTLERRIDDNRATQIKKRQIVAQSELGGRSSEMADTNGAGGWGVGSLEHGRENVFRKSDQLRGENGFTSGSWWEVEPSVGRVANGVSDRVDRLKGLGNAIVPQVAELVGALVVEHSQN
jgi:DNA (cytosine-5)-methyltransferase 1